MTKDEISHEETRSKIGHHRVQKEKFERTSLFLCCGVGDRSTQSRGRSVGGGVAKLSAMVMRRRIAVQLSTLCR